MASATREVEVVGAAAAAERGYKTQKPQCRCKLHVARCTQYWVVPRGGCPLHKADRFCNCHTDPDFGRLRSRSCPVHAD